MYVCFLTNCKISRLKLTWKYICLNLILKVNTICLPESKAACLFFTLFACYMYCTLLATNIRKKNTQKTMRIIVNSRTVTETISKSTHNSSLALQLQLEFEYTLRLRVREFENRFCCKFLSHYCVPSARRKRTLALSMLDCYLLAFVVVVVLEQATASASSADAKRQAAVSRRLAPTATATEHNGPTVGQMQQQQQHQQHSRLLLPASRATSCVFAVSFSHSLGQRIRCAAHCLLGYVPPLCSESFPALSLSAGINKAFKLFGGTFKWACSGSSALINTNMLCRYLRADWQQHMLTRSVHQQSYLGILKPGLLI